LYLDAISPLPTPVEKPSQDGPGSAKILHPKKNRIKPQLIPSTTIGGDPILVNTETSARVPSTTPNQKQSGTSSGVTSAAPHSPAHKVNVIY
jgi:hypothetical protein